ncbi:hypothetical protein ACFQLX_05230 [Streptomyces polyrhachis]|uniref:Secreted protein n=1 Tax=Streptomyces polyrhachis TaxID=1282885 RepID=A0ABW2GC47_9ACTN
MAPRFPGAAAVALCAALTAPVWLPASAASAAPAHPGHHPPQTCTTPDGGAQGSFRAEFTTARRVELDIHAKDLKADRRTAQVRLVTVSPDGSRHYYRWHAVPNGKHGVWKTFALNRKGIVSAHLQTQNVGRDGLVWGTCVTKKALNPHW